MLVGAASLDELRPVSGNFAASVSQADPTHSGLSCQAQLNPIFRSEKCFLGLGIYTALGPNVIESVRPAELEWNEMIEFTGVMTSGFLRTCDAIVAIRLCFSGFTCCPVANACCFVSDILQC